MLRAAAFRALRGHRRRRLSVFLESGTIIEETRTFDASDLAAFAALTGDHNPIHAAPTPPFDAPIVHGMLVASLFPALFSKHWPNAVYRDQTLAFKAAVPAGAAVTTRIVVVDVRTSASRGAFAACETAVVFAGGDNAGAVAVAGAARLWLPTAR